MPQKRPASCCAAGEHRLGAGVGRRGAHECGQLGVVGERTAVEVLVERVAQAGGVQAVNQRGGDRARALGAARADDGQRGGEHRIGRVAGGARGGGGAAAGVNSAADDALRM